jgi:hypothetical protein
MGLNMTRITIDKKIEHIWKKQNIIELFTLTTSLIKETKNFIASQSRTWYFLKYK